MEKSDEDKIHLPYHISRIKDDSGPNMRLAKCGIVVQDVNVTRNNKSITCENCLDWAKYSRSKRKKK